MENQHESFGAVDTDLHHTTDEQRLQEKSHDVSALHSIPGHEQLTRAFTVETPIGLLLIQAKHKGRDSAMDYPGVYVDFINPYTRESILLACVEYCSETGGRGHIQSCVHGDGLTEEPSHIIIHENINIADLEAAQQKIEDFYQKQYGESIEADFFDLERVPVARTCVENTDEQLEVATYLDLMNLTCWTDIVVSTPENQSVTVRATEYPTLTKMIEEEIEHLNFCELVALDDKDWDNFTWSEAGKSWLRHRFPTGTRIRLEYMEDRFPVAPGTEGTVELIDGAGNIHVLWDDGRTLALAYGIDQFTVISCPDIVKLDYPPVYRKPWSAATFFSEQKAFRASMDENLKCASRIGQAISRYYADCCLKTDLALAVLIPEFGLDRLSFVLANTIRAKMNDGRIDRSNKEWAYSVNVPGDDKGHDYNPDFLVDNPNPGLVNLLVNGLRRRLDVQHTEAE